jgi:hypothetical protein
LVVETHTISQSLSLRQRKKRGIINHVSHRANPPKENVMQLIYRGQTLPYTPTEASLYRKPQALNWRFQAPGETYSENPTTIAAYRKPHAINWRWQ